MNLTVKILSWIFLSLVGGFVIGYISFLFGGPITAFLLGLVFGTTYGIFFRGLTSKKVVGVFIPLLLWVGSILYFATIDWGSADIALLMIVPIYLFVYIGSFYAGTAIGSKKGK